MKRPSPVDVDLPDGVKRRKSLHQDARNDEEAKDAWPRLAGVNFPVQVAALPHVLKLIDTLLMAPEDALLEAAALGQFQLVGRILDRFECSVSEAAVVAAAANGHVNAVWLLLQEFSDDDDEWKLEAVEIAKKAVVSAAANGHDGVVDVLLPGIIGVGGVSITATTLGVLKETMVGAAKNGHVGVVKIVLPELIGAGALRPNYNKYGGWSDALTEAAANGHLDVVKFAVEHAIEGGYRHYYSQHPDALSRAITGGYDDMVNYLLPLKRFCFDLKEAFVEALRMENWTLTETIRKLCSKQTGRGSLFTDLAVSGQTNAVKFLFDNGDNDSELVCTTFLKAAECGQLDVIEFLLGSERVSDSAFDKGFVLAATSSARNPDVVRFLFGKKRVSPESVNKAFAGASSMTIISFLDENATISSEAINTAFKRLADHGSSFAKILKFLYQKKCLTSESISEAFVSVATWHETESIELLRSDPRITPEAGSQAFSRVACGGDLELAESLCKSYGYPISSESILEVFRRAGSDGFRKTIEFLSCEPSVPLAVKQEAFVNAAGWGEKWVLEILSERDEWPLDILKKALLAASSGWNTMEVKWYLRKKICNLLLDI